MARMIIENCAIATVDARGSEFARGHIVIDGSYITAVGDGPGPPDPPALRIDGGGCLATPGLVNTHHHLYQWATRGMAQDSRLFSWLRELYPMWSRLDGAIVHDTTAAGLAWLALSGCTSSADHHYIFPRRHPNLLDAQVEAARAIGLRFHPCRGSMDRGRSSGGLPPDSLVEEVDRVLEVTADAIDVYHDPRPESMLRIAVAPCSPFSVSSDLMSASAELARVMGVRMHTHIAETADEEGFCREMHGIGPVEYLDKLEWLGPDVWLAHAVHLSTSDVLSLARAEASVAHCPGSNGRLGTGLAPVRHLLDAGVRVGLGVDGAASQESGLMVEELRHALYVARLRNGPESLTVREALTMGTMGGAHCLGRVDEIGSLEPGKLADIALWRIDGLGHAGIADPVVALVLGPPAPVELLLVGGRVIVSGAQLRTADQAELTRALVRSANRIRKDSP